MYANVWNSDLVPEMYDYALGAQYDPSSEEELIRDQYGLDYKSYRQSLKDIDVQSRQNLKSTRGSIGRSGFAGGGGASKGIFSGLKSSELAKKAAKKGWEATQLGHTEDIYSKREKYREDLWNRYQAFATKANLSEFIGTEQYRDEIGAAMEGDDRLLWERLQDDVW